MCSRGGYIPYLKKEIDDKGKLAKQNKGKLEKLNQEIQETQEKNIKCFI